MADGVMETVFVLTRALSMKMWLRAVGISTFIGILACGPAPQGDGDASSDRIRTAMLAPSMALCPPGFVHSYESFGRDFFANYCEDCHSSARTTPAERQGAPFGYDFDSLEGVRAHLAEIDAAAAGGPTRINIFMPMGAMPSDAERDRLGEWIACGAP
jgi:hypothetical protein